MIFTEITKEAAREIFAPLTKNNKWDTSDGLCGVDDLLGGGRAYVVEQDGQKLGAFIIQKVTREHGRELEIRAGWAFTGRCNLTQQIVPEIERRWGYDCDTVTIYTRRAGLMKKLKAQGFRESAVILTKKIGA